MIIIIILFYVEELSSKMMDLHSNVSEFSSRMDKVLSTHEASMKLKETFQKLYVWKDVHIR